MMLYKLSFKNIQKSFKDYTIYFFTLILGVAIFYLFNAIESQTVLLDVSESTYEIIDLMNQILSGVSVFVSLILAFLIIYANRFLMKRRNKEFGIYLILGMGKRKISMILFVETLIIGIISLGVGLIFGIVLSQFTSLLVANMFEANLTQFTFVFSLKATIKTCLYFSIIYFVVMLLNTYNVNRYELIDLLNSSKKSEKIKLKNTYLCIFIFIVSCIALGYAYYLVAIRVNQLDNILIPIAIGATSTFFIFWSLSGLLLKIFMSMRNVYYKGLNSFTLRQFSSKINTTVFSMTFICLMLFVTICVLSSALSIKNSMTANLKEMVPVDVEMDKTLDLTEDYIGGQVGYTREEVEDSHKTVRETLKDIHFDVDRYYKDILELNLYVTNDVTIEKTLGDYESTSKELYPQLSYNDAETFMKISDYNRLAKIYGFNTYTLNDNEYFIIADFDGWINIRNEALKLNTPVQLLNQTYYPKFKECQYGFVYLNVNHVNTGIFVVPDHAVDETMRVENIFIANYNAHDKQTKQDIENQLLSLGKEYENQIIINASTKLSLYEGSVGLGAMVTFIGLYLGIIFLISSAAILALKELSESSDNKERFAMLRKLGTDELLINQALFRQIGIFFMFPLLLAIIHSIFGIQFSSYILATFGTQELIHSIIITAIFIVAIYGGYFLLTYQCSKNIIKER